MSQSVPAIERQVERILGGDEDDGAGRRDGADISCHRRQAAGVKHSDGTIVA